MPIATGSNPRRITTRLGVLLGSAVLVVLLTFARLSVTGVVDQVPTPIPGGVPTTKVVSGVAPNAPALLDTSSVTTVDSTSATYTAASRHREPRPAQDRDRATSDAVAALEEALSALDRNSGMDAREFCEAQRKRLWDKLRAHGPPRLVELFEAQRRRHEAVAAGRPLPGQKYLVWSLAGGLGNRFLSLASTFMAAVLSERVFLMKDWFTPLPRGNTKQTPVIIPSPNSTEYFLEDLRKVFAPASCPRNVELLCPFLPMMSLSEFRDMYPAEFDARNHAEHAKVDIAAKHDRKLVRWNRFMCAPLNGQAQSIRQPDRDAAIFFREKFVYVWTNQYYLPALFANPHHSADMRAMFPTNRPYQDLIGLLAVPSLPVVKRIKAFFDREREANGVAVHRSGPRYDALQIRAFQRHAIAGMARDFDTCWSRMKRLAGDGSSRAPFFLASMHGAVRKHFFSRYGNATRVQAPPTEEQCTGVCDAACDQEGFADMMLLALSGRLLVSPGSTFGMFVSAFAQKPPIAVRDQGSCRAIPNVEPCFGSWFRRDHILRRATAVSPDSPFSCRIDDVPAGIVNCEQS